MDRKTVGEIRNAMNEALVEVGKKFNVKMRVGNCKYGISSAKYQVESLDIAKDGTVFDKEAENFQFALLYGLQITDLGKKFYQNRELYTICGLESKAKKYPLLAKRASNGKKYKFSAEEIKRILNDPKTKELNKGDEKC